MSAVQRRCDGRLAKAELTPSGSYRIPATLTRVGVLEYRQPDGSIQRELRHPDDVFAASSLATLRGAPLTHLHPSEPVDPKNFRSLAVGHVADNVRQDSDHVASDVLVTEAQAISLVGGGSLAELSCGYDCKIEQTPGEWNGSPYDVRQRNIAYNHVALLPVGHGRAGSSVCLRLDSAGNEIDAVPASADAPPAESEKVAPRQTELFPPGDQRADTAEGQSASPHTGKDRMSKNVVTVGGESYDPAADGVALAQAVARQDSALADAKRVASEAGEALKASQAQVTEATQRADAADKAREIAEGSLGAAETKLADLQKRLDAAETALKEATSPEALDARVAVRTKVISDARRIVGKGADGFKTDGLSDVEIKKATCSAVHGAEKIKGKSDVWVEASFDYLAEHHQANAGEARADGADKGSDAGNGEGLPTQPVGGKEPLKRFMEAKPLWAQPLSGGNN